MLSILTVVMTSYVISTMAYDVEKLDCAVKGHGKIAVNGKLMDYNIQDNQYIVEGDIIIGDADQLSDRRRLVPITIGILWPNKYIPYIIDSSLSSTMQSTTIPAAISHWESNTDIRFGAHNGEIDYVRFISGSGCSSRIGKSGFEQHITLSDACTLGNIIHELGHCIGFWHTHSREDRDEYISINYNNIEEDEKHNFDRRVFEADDCLTYDYGSIMHYHRTAFAIDTNIATITPLQSLNGVIMGQRNGLSDTDKACVNVLYQRCCKDGICVEKQKDWANVYYCPDECKAGVDCPFGSCESMNTKSEYESCSCSGQCSGDLKCCNNECRYLQNDWAGVPYCPHECKRGAFCPQGSCNDNKSEYQSCECDEQCSGSMGCCNGQCRYKQRDWARIYYCPNICKAGIDCPPGSCSDNKYEYQSCQCSGQCSGSMTCCNGQCRHKQRDWAGVYYCPHECNGGCGWGGTCPNNRGSGQSCSCRAQCNSGCCENGRCVDKKRDWAGVYYCPAECRGGIFSGAGTC